MTVRLATSKSGEALCYGAATVGAFAPLYFILPGADQRLAHQTAKWAPRWERNIGFFTPAAERGIKRVEPPVSRAVRAVDNRLPLEKFAQGIDRRIRLGIDRVSASGNSNINGKK